MPQPPKFSLRYCSASLWTKQNGEAIYETRRGPTGAERRTQRTPQLRRPDGLPLAWPNLYPQRPIPDRLRSLQKVEKIGAIGV